MISAKLSLTTYRLYFTFELFINSYIHSLLGGVIRFCIFQIGGVMWFGLMATGGGQVIFVHSPGSSPGPPSLVNNERSLTERADYATILAPSNLMQWWMVWPFSVWHNTESNVNIMNLKSDNLATNAAKSRPTVDSNSHTYNNDTSYSVRLNDNLLHVKCSWQDKLHLSQLFFSKTSIIILSIFIFSPKTFKSNFHCHNI